jgi:hypothetical protein
MVIRFWEHESIESALAALVGVLGSRRTRFEPKLEAPNPGDGS